LAFVKKENLFYFEMSAMSGENMKKLIYNSISELPFFDQYRNPTEDIISELEMENNGTDRGNNSSFLDSSRAIIKKKKNCSC
jgi:hypothetical protein